MGHIAIYPGSFDPVTNGHLDIIERAAKLFDQVRVVVMINMAKQTLFTTEARMEMLRAVVADLPNVTVDSFAGLTAEYARRQSATILIRGLRAVSDFDAEFRIALTNAKLNPDLEAVFLMTRAEYLFLSSSGVKEIASLGGPIDDFVAPLVATALKQRFQSDVSAPR